MKQNEKQFRKRNAILSFLKESKAHPSAESLYEIMHKEMPDISLATVYRNLAYFKQQGAIISLGTVGGVERFDGRTDPHVHFGCTRCGKVCDADFVCCPDDIPTSVSEKMGCHIDAVQLMLSGVCKECMEKTNM